VFGPKTAGQNNNQAVIIKTFFINQPADRTLKGPGCADFQGDVIRHDPERKGKPAHHPPVIDLGIDGIVPPVGCQLQDGGAGQGIRHNGLGVQAQGSLDRCLGKIGGENILKTIKGLVGDDNGIVVCAALEAMAKIAAGERQTIEEIKPWVVKCLSHNDTEVVKAALQVIARIDKEGAASAILPLLEHADWDVRAQVVDILSDRKDDFIRNCLKTHLKVETDNLVKQKITEALKGP